MNQDKIIPCIWYITNNGEISELIEYYKNIFGKDFHNEQIVPLGETPSGNAEMCEVSIFNQRYSMMSTSIAHQLLNDAISLMINCDNQNEIDKYWNYFTLEGKESQCGWCEDKYGLRWQIIPKIMGELMSKPKAFEVMMKQKKIVIEEFLK